MARMGSSSPGQEEKGMDFVVDYHDRASGYSPGDNHVAC